MAASLLHAFIGRSFRGGFTISRLEITDESLVDAIGRDALAKTSIIGRRLEIVIRTPLSDEELSITLYHEILEGITVASEHPPSSVMMFNEGDYERAAQQAHAEFGPASPENLDRLLQSYGFREE